MNALSASRKHVVLIDDERPMRESVRQWLTLAEFEVDVYDNGFDAIKTLNRDFQGVVVTDLKMPDMNGMDVISKCLEIDADIPVVLITGHGDINSAVKAMQLGSYDFIEKPFEPDRLLTTIKRATEKRHLVVQNRALQQRVVNAPNMQQRLLGDSSVIKQLRNEIAEFAQIDINVLLTGETGTGKEVIAQCLHDFGKRAGAPFHAIDCGALPNDGIDAALFGVAGEDGHEGQLSIANGGTLFLDELLNMPVSQQVKLLRVLQSGEIQLVGQPRSMALDIRVVSAANESLQKAIKDDQFRSDLYFRLNTIELNVPPLRERDNDVVILFDHFANNAAQTYNRNIPILSNIDVTTLKSHAWPGNVRQLKTTAERFVLYQNKRIADILNESAEPKQKENLQDQVAAFEKSMIEFALGQCQGNITAACKQLGLPRRTLNDKLVRHDIDRSNYTQES